jgi:hypothetical protein
MANALSGDSMTVWFAPASTLGTGLAAGGKKIQTFVTDWSKGGGAKDTESVPLMGGANIDRKKPREQIELSFDIILQHGTDVDYFDQVADGAIDVGMIVLESKVGTDYYWKAFNNVSATLLEEEGSADEEWKGTLTLKLSPTDTTAKKNKISGKTSSCETELDATSVAGGGAYENSSWA